jgi:transcriptional regulator with XRE-family HTH domain
MGEEPITNDGVAITVVRRLRGFSKRELAQKSGITASRLTAIEYGVTAQPEELSRIWRALAFPERVS